MNTVLMIVLGLYTAAMAYAAVSDLLTMTIPNRLSILLLAAFPVSAYMLGLPVSAIAWNLLAGAVVLACTFGMFAAGWIGGGDAKLAAATAVWCGFSGLLPYLLYASMFGGALTLAMLAARRYPVPQFAHWPWLLRLHDSKTGIPYGIALAAAALVVAPELQIFKVAF